MARLPAFTLASAESRLLKERIEYRLRVEWDETMDMLMEVIGEDIAKSFRTRRTREKYAGMVGSAIIAIASHYKEPHQ